MARVAPFGLARRHPRSAGRDEAGGSLRRPRVDSRWTGSGVRAALPGVLEDVEAVVAIARGHVFHALVLEDLDAPEVVAARCLVVDERTDLDELVVDDAQDAEPAGVV